jgi:hypothetical protein
VLFDVSVLHFVDEVADEVADLAALVLEGEGVDGVVQGPITREEDEYDEDEDEEQGMRESTQETTARRNQSERPSLLSKHGHQ